MEYCNDVDFLRTFHVVLVIIQVIRILIPIILIITIIVDIIKSSLGSNPTKIADPLKRMGRRILAGVIIFLIPSLIQGVIYIFSNQKAGLYACIENATDKKLVEIIYKNARDSVNEAKNNLDLDSYYKALGAVGKVENEYERAKLEAILDDVRIALEIKGVIKLSISGSIDEREYAKKIKTESIRNDVNGYLDAQDDINGTPSSFQDKDEEPIPPKSSDTIVRKAETETLKVYITKRGDNYVTKIWAADPYNQLNKYDSPEYGKNLYRPGELLKRAMNAKSITGKVIIGFNASGFYLADVYDKASVKYYPAYNKTSVGSLVITNGKVVRNAYNKAYKTWFVAGVKPNGELQIFTDAKTLEKESAEKKKWADAVINSKIRNTFTFASILVKNGTKSDITTSMPSINSTKNRQAICQINKNNFILITGPSLNREKLINIMLNEKCITGTNFDGGGSIALLFKPANSTKIETIIGNRRSLSEVGYFTE